jgi:hypothetical protein
MPKPKGNFFMIGLLYSPRAERFAGQRRRTLLTGIPAKLGRVGTAIGPAASYQEREES